MRTATLVLISLLAVSCFGQVTTVTPPFDIDIVPSCTASNTEGGLVALDCNEMRYHVQIREQGGAWFTMWEKRAPEYPAPGDTVVYEHQGTGLVETTIYEVQARTWYPETYFTRSDGGKFRVTGYSAFKLSNQFEVDLTPAPADTIDLILDGIQVIIIRNKK